MGSSMRRLINTKPVKGNGGRVRRNISQPQTD